MTGLKKTKLWLAFAFSYILVIKKMETMIIDVLNQRFFYLATSLVRFKCEVEEVKIERVARKNCREK